MSKRPYTIRGTERFATSQSQGSSEARRIDLLVDEAEITRRLAGWTPPAARFSRGYGKLFLDQTTQADHGCDFRFLERGGPTPEPDIF